MNREALPASLAPFNRPIFSKAGRTKCGLPINFNTFGDTFILFRGRQFKFDPANDDSLRAAIRRARNSEEN